DIGLHSRRRNIHGNNCGTREILRNALDNGAVQTLDWLSYPGSKKRVHHDIGIEQFQLFFIPIVFIQDDCWRVSERLQDIQIRLGVAFDLLFRCAEKDEREPTFLYQLPRDNETVTAVVSLAAENRHGELVKIFKSIFKNFGHTHPGVLHQNETRNPVFFGGKAIDFAELLRREDFHGGRKFGVRRPTSQIRNFEIVNWTSTFTIRFKISD